jgi:hypothetical protein
MQNIVMFDVVSQSLKIYLFCNKIIELNMVSGNLVFIVPTHALHYTLKN